MRARTWITVALIILSFSLGRNWPVAYQMISDTFDRYRNFNVVHLWQGREAWATKYPFEASLLSVIPPVAFAVLAFAASRSRRWILARFGVTSVLDMLFSKQDVVHIVSSSIAGASFRSGGKFGQTITTPDNVTLVPFQDAKSVQIIIDHVQQVYKGRKAVRVWASGSFDIPADQNLIAIGGPYVNKLTRHYIEDLGVEGFAIDEQTVGHLGADTYAPRVDGRNQVIEDYGFAFCLRSPNSESQRVLLLFGLWSPGTRAAAEAAVGLIGLTGQAVRTRRRFRQLVGRGKDAVAIIRAGGPGTSDLQNAFHDAREVRLLLHGPEVPADGPAPAHAPPAAAAALGPAAPPLEGDGQAPQEESLQ